ncbi:MAG: hypothetical protein FWC27_11945 [Firmicutes bacterium]|nr:hypothetical protein [Bacillota bacterium]
MIQYKCADFDNFSCCCPYNRYDSEGAVERICEHPDPADKDGESDGDGNWIVKCVDWNCPLCLSVEQEDEGRDDVDWDDYTHVFPVSEFGDPDLVLVYIGQDAPEGALEAWNDYDRWMNRYNPDWKPKEELHV